MKYYINENDTLYAVDENRNVFIYNLTKKDFVPSKAFFDVMNWNEISAEEIKNYMK